MGNNGSFMEKVYVYLPVIMCHSKIDYGDRTTMRYIRLGYFLEQASKISRGHMHVYRRGSVFNCSNLEDCPLFPCALLRTVPVTLTYTFAAYGYPAPWILVRIYRRS